MNDINGLTSQLDHIIQDIHEHNLDVEEVCQYIRNGLVEEQLNDVAITQEEVINMLRKDPIWQSYCNSAASSIKGLPNLNQLLQRVHVVVGGLTLQNYDWKLIREEASKF